MGLTPLARMSAQQPLPERTIALAALGPVAPFDDRASVAELGGELRVAVKLARRAQSCEGPAARRRTRARDPAYWQIHEQATAEILAQPAAIAPWGWCR
jgi:hypothetical protein